jgi:ligand-binding sensor domain-containing protein/two-component sensor histidine kinase
MIELNNLTSVLFLPAVEGQIKNENHPPFLSLKDLERSVHLFFLSKPMKKIIFGVLALLNFLLLSAQTPYYRIYDGRFGLPSSEVYNVTQDDLGYLWFSTDHGLARFDGYQFETFDMQDGLPENAVFYFRKDHLNRIWFNTYDGKLGYIQDGQIFPYHYNHLLSAFFKEKKLTFTIFRSFYMDEKETMHIFLSGVGSFSVDAKGRIELVRPQQPKELHVIFNDFGDASYLGENLQVYDYVVFHHNNSTHRVSLPQKDDFVSAKQNLTALTHNNNFYLAYGKNIYRFQNEAVTDSFSCENQFSGIHFDTNGDLWATAVAGGVFVLDAHLRLKEHLYQNETFTDFYQDHEGGIWLTTLNRGILHIPDLRHRLFSSSDGLPNEPIVDIGVDWQSRLWMAFGSGKLGYFTDNGLRLFDLNLTNNNGEIKMTFDNSHKRIWVANDRSLFYIEQEQLHHLKPPQNLKKKFLFTIKTIAFDSVKNKLWLGNFTGASSLDGDPELGIPQKIKGNFLERVESIETTRTGAVWIGSTRGLFYYGGDTLINYGKRSPSLLGGRIIALQALGDSLWIGTRGNGLLLLTPDTLRQFTERDGLPSNSIRKIEVADNFLIVGANDGLIVMKRKLEDGKIVLQRQLAASELISKEIMQIVQKDKSTYVLSRKGLSVYCDITNSGNVFQLPVLLRQVMVKNKPIEIIENPAFAFSDNSLSFNYFGISFLTQGKQTYRHRLLGLENEWVNNQQTIAQYPFLPPGAYRFEVEVMNTDGSWSTSRAAFDFTILTPFWRKWWFIALVTLAVISTMIGIFRIYAYRISRQKQLISDINRYHQEALANQMNPHFLFNALNTVQRYILENDKVSSSRYLSKFSSLMRTMVSNAQHQRITLQKEIEALTLYIEVEVARFKDRFTFHFDCDSDIDVEKTTIPVFFIQPLVENAIKHGLMNKTEHGELKISFYRKKNTLFCEVLDNGIGRTEARRIANKLDKQSLGISIIQKRISLINKSTNEGMYLEYEDLFSPENQACGTKVTLVFPNILNNTSQHE